MTLQEFLSEIKYHMRHYKDAWYEFAGMVDDKAVQIRLYGKSIARLCINGLDYGGLWDMGTQKAVLTYIEKALTD